MTEPTRVQIEIPADYEGIVTVELEITKAGVSVKQSEPEPTSGDVGESKLTRDA